MNLYTYSNYYDPEIDKAFKKGTAQLATLPPHVQVAAVTIAQADEAYELSFGLNPGRFQGHTPPILVAIEFD